MILKSKEHYREIYFLKTWSLDLLVIIHITEFITECLYDSITAVYMILYKFATQNNNKDSHYREI